MADPYTIKIFVQSGDPDGVRIVELMNWTGRGVLFPRLEWDRIRTRTEFEQSGIYVLIGQDENDDLPTLYIGQTDTLLKRLETHNKDLPFWDRAMVFVSLNGLNRGHLTWLEYALLQRAKDIAQCRLKNDAFPKEPTLSESEKADTQSFLNHVLQILPLVGLRALEKPRAIVTAKPVPTPIGAPDEADTIVVPAQPEGFEKVFLGENSWYAVRISGGMLKKIRYIAGYQTQPVSAITYYAQVERIEPYGENGKYRLFFAEKAKKIGPIPYGDMPPGSMQAPRYTSFEKLRTAKSLSDLFS